MDIISEKNADFVLETERLLLRKFRQSDMQSLRNILQDKEVMYAYEHAFDDGEVRQWFERQLERYRKDGFGLWAVVLKETGETIGQCGITLQDCGGAEVAEIGYLFAKKFWHNGFATEAAVACRNYAFEVLGLDEVYSIIRDNNIASQNVARRNGMENRGVFIKRYYGIDMPHYVFSVKRR